MHVHHARHSKFLIALFLTLGLGNAAGCAGEPAGTPFEGGDAAPPGTQSGDPETGTGEGGEGGAGTRRGDVSVFWSAWDARAIANAAFLDDAGGCTVRESGACREFTCGSRVPSVSAGTLRIRGTAPSLVLDMEHRDGTYFASNDANVPSQASSAPSKSAGSKLVISTEGSPAVPGFETEIAYPEQLVLTYPPVDDPDSVPSVPKKRVRLPRSGPVVLRWAGGAPDVWFRVEGVGTSTSPSRTVVCEAVSANGAMEIESGMLDGLVLRAFTVAERRITTGSWPVTVRIGTEVLVRSHSSGTAYDIADFGGG